MTKIANDSVVAPNFTSVYPDIISHILNKGDRVQSRVGYTAEILNFKTDIQNPMQRCVGGLGRNINVFFLLAEALWIWAGRNDVEFLKLFNNRMGDYSDNGTTFNAPYGFRLRHYGHDSNNSFVVDEKTDQQVRYDHLSDLRRFTKDQVLWALELLNQDPGTRRAVMSIWNAEFDTVESKDIPCNDLVMLKIRKGKLHMTIANRSNDLHWGLCTNVFQFSFVLEIMSGILGVEVGTQTHNSQSLHIYLDNPITDNMAYAINLPGIRKTNLYNYAEASPMGFEFPQFLPTKERLGLVDGMISTIISDVFNYGSSGSFVLPMIAKPREYELFPYYFKQITKILCVYVLYTRSKRNEESKINALIALLRYYKEGFNCCEDYYMLAMNWFAARLPEDKVTEATGTEQIFKQLPNKWLGKL